MVVQMILGEVGKDTNVEVASCAAFLVERVGGDLHGDAAAAVAQHVRKGSLEFRAAWGRVVRRATLLAVIVTDGADEASALPCLFHDVVAEVADGSLAVGAGDTK